MAISPSYGHLAIRIITSGHHAIWITSPRDHDYLIMSSGSYGHARTASHHIIMSIRHQSTK